MISFDVLLLTCTFLFRSVNVYIFAFGMVSWNLDPHEALLAYRATPPENGFSPAELCIEGRLRTTLPTIPSKLIPQWPELAKLRETEERIKSKQGVKHNQRHAGKELSDLLPGDRVYVPDHRENAVVVNKTPEPRSY